MFLKSLLILLFITASAMCMNLNSDQKKFKDVLYFEAHDAHKVDEINNKKVLAEAVVCPDGSECPDGNTCCLLTSGDYGCCPLPDAVCCSDHAHCCPNGYICDVSAGTCNKGTNVVSWLTKVAAKPVKDTVECKDGSECPSGNSCCQLASGQFGCCPLEQAECCSDHIHCCPNGYTCDTTAGTCSLGTNVVSWLTKTEAKPVKTSVTCEDGTECPDGNTCCQLGSGEYGCCPLPQAECCSDHIHCCPNGYTCDTTTGTCSLGTNVVSWLTKTEAKPVKTSVRCEDGTECPDGNTCCQLGSGEYGCCPLPQAECCSDHIHCCPNGYTCDTTTGTCSLGTNVVSWLTKTEAKPVKTSVRCEDGTECPDGNTCCQLGSGEYGCCPLPQAECCSDHIHCCPNGYTCDTTTGTCSLGTNVVSWLTKTEAKPVKTSVRCEDGTECPDGNTCCQLGSGEYGCCPLPQAECCSDHIHCCPNGYTCDTTTGTCSLGTNVVSWLTKTEAKPVKTSVTCEDGTECPDGNTCCQLGSGEYGCCPLPQAECCSDHIHCCPNGYTCDTTAGTCSLGTNVVSWLTKTEAKPVKTSVRCEDGTECPDGNTCCQRGSGEYGCCPLPQAECCSDQIHCCPEDYQCDVSAGTCTHGNNVITWLMKQPSRPVKKSNVNTVVCPGAEAFCPDGNSCCKMYPTQAYGCCPFPKAVCCFLHCCPEGYTCNNQFGTCDKGTHALPWLTRQPIMPAANNV